MEEGRINGNELKTELKRIRTQIIKLQKKKLGQKDKIAFAHYRISNLEQIIKEIQARYHSYYVLSSVDRMPPKRTSTSAAPAMTQDAIRQLVADSVATALKAQAANMANTDNIKEHRTSRKLRRKEKESTITKESLKIEETPPTTTTIPNTTTITTPTIATITTTKITITTTKTTITMITTNSRTRKTEKLLGSYNASKEIPWKPPFSCTSAPDITQAFALPSACELSAASQCSKTDNNTFHVSKKYLCDESLIIPKKENLADDCELNYRVEKSVEIMSAEVKLLSRRCIPIVKVTSSWTK
ncbi:hypothetical protein Tco_0458991 [Tanacetum coccineum]